MHCTLNFLSNLSIAVGLLFCATSCKYEDTPLTDSDVVGVWKLQGSSFRSEEYNQGDFKDFELRIRIDSTFTASAIPPGLFLNKSTEAADLIGTWAMRYDDGHNYLRFTITNLPGYTSGTYGGPLQWEDGDRVFRLGGNGFIYLQKATETTGEQDARGNGR